METSAPAPVLVPSRLDTLRGKFAGTFGSAGEFDAICEIVEAVIDAGKPKAPPTPEPKPVSASRGKRPKMKAAKAKAGRSARR
jgi:hypothetical protein